jgi:hypothetical protein
VNDEFRAITKIEWNFDSSVMTSSLMPSAKYSCSGSPLMFAKGRTATEGLSRRGTAGWLAAGAGAPTFTSYARSEAMFLTSRSPRSTNVIASRFRTAPCTTSDTMIPPGGASPSSRAAMFTPSP